MGGKKVKHIVKHYFGSVICNVSFETDKKSVRRCDLNLQQLVIQQLKFMTTATTTSTTSSKFCFVLLFCFSEQLNVAVFMFLSLSLSLTVLL